MLLTLLSGLLYNVKFIGLCFVVFYLILWIEDNLNFTEEAFWTCLGAIAVFLLFKFDSKWKKLCDYLTDKIYLAVMKQK